MSMEILPAGMWYIEKLVPDYGHFFVVKRLITSHKTRYQKIEIFEHEVFGKLMFLDGNLQLATSDEWIYHEVLVHQPMLTHKEPKRVAVIGGGDGGSLREVLKHSCVEEVYLVDLDPGVIEASEKYLPEVCGEAFKDERVIIVCEEGRSFLEKSGRFDVILCDITDPFTGLSAKLFTKEFYKLVKDRLDENGVFATQAEASHHSHLYFKISFPTVTETLRQIFDIVVPYTAYIPSYGTEWGFALATDLQESADAGEKEIMERMKDRCIDTRFYTPQIYKRLASLPLNLQGVIENYGEVMSDEQAEELVELAKRVITLGRKISRDEILSQGREILQAED